MAGANVRRDSSRVLGKAADAMRQESLNKQEKTSNCLEVSGAPSGIRDEQSDGIVSLPLGKVNRAFPSVRLLMARANVRRDVSRVHATGARHSRGIPARARKKLRRFGALVVRPQGFEPGTH